jgi:sugar-specific transcriptional regulator TrmB
MADFSELGLTKNEEKVFSALVKIGKASSSTISQDSGVSYSRIYDVLASLEHKGLVKVVPEKGKKFVPGDPEALKKLIEQKRQLLDELDKEVVHLKSLYEVKEKEVVEVARGSRNFYKLEREMPSPKKLCYNIKYSGEYRPEWERGDRILLKNKGDLKELFRVDSETKENVKKWLRVHKNLREIPNKGIAISLVDDKVILISLIKSNVQLLIKDKAFIEMMQELIKAYYLQAKPIKL